MKSIYISATFLCLILAIRVHSTECINFVSPEQGSIIEVPSCTLQVSSECEKIKSVEFQARYFISSSDTPVIKSLGVITRAPFKLIWDVTDIPNQLLSGVAFLAEATFSKDSTETVRREGVFFTHQKITRPSLIIPYEFHGRKELLPDSIIFNAPRSAMAISGSVYWNEKELTVIVDVKDPLFYVNMTREDLSNLGIEVLIDPFSSRKPFPHKDVHIYNVPLYGNAYRMIYKPVFDDSGSFTLVSKSLPGDFDISIKKEDFKGFRICFPIPMKEFSDSLPKSFGMNLIVKTFGQGKQIVRTPWVKGNILEAYSPFIWGNTIVQPKPFFKNRLLMWSIFFVAGFVFTFIVYQILTSFKKPQKFVKFERSEVEQQQFEKIKEAIERKITQKNLSNERFAHELKMSCKRLNKLIKKFTGMSFYNYLMFCRIEIAMERLRSSHCSEASIAESCGFATVHELEKYFQKFHHTTPFKYRNQQQVS
ncbi:MAG TPA: AraC family transcriptional regulator [Chitinispirillaceae bacterium]|nr:AraC family transcriptional regulator [Chitinispirillaceae bacterium]